MTTGPSKMHLRLLLGALITARDAIDLTILVLRGFVDLDGRDDEEEATAPPPAGGPEKPPTFHSAGAAT